MQWGTHPLPPDMKVLLVHIKGVTRVCRTLESGELIPWSIIDLKMQLPQTLLKFVIETARQGNLDHHFVKTNLCSTTEMAKIRVRSGFCTVLDRRKLQNQKPRSRRKKYQIISKAIHHGQEVIRLFLGSCRLSKCKYRLGVSTLQLLNSAING